MHQLKLMGSEDLLIIFFHPIVIHNLFEEGCHEFLEVSIAGFSFSILYVQHIFDFVDEFHDDIVVIAVFSIFEQDYWMIEIIVLECFDIVDFSYYFL